MYGAAEIPRVTPSPSRQAGNCVPCEPAFELLRQTVQGKCGACVLVLCAADSAVAMIFLFALPATAQRSQRSQALAGNARRGQCGAKLAVGTTRVLYTCRQTPPVPTALRPVYGRVEQEAHPCDCEPNICVGGESLRSVQRPPAVKPPEQMGPHSHEHQNHASAWLERWSVRHVRRAAAPDPKQNYSQATIAILKPAFSFPPVATSHPSEPTKATRRIHCPNRNSVSAPHICQPSAIITRPAEPNPQPHVLRAASAYPDPRTTAPQKFGCGNPKP